MKHPIDVHVGKRIRYRRWMVGMTQQQLADRVGIRFQQIQKYETGTNRVSASRLWEISEALDATVAHFFDGLSDKQPETGRDMLADREAVELVRACYRMPDKQRRRLFDLARALSETAA